MIPFASIDQLHSWLRSQGLPTVSVLLEQRMAVVAYLFKREPSGEVHATRYIEY